MWNEFKTFLIKQNVLALAIAVVVGAALNQLVNATVDAWIMPIIGVATPGGEWQEATVGVGQLQFRIGHFASALLNFLIVSLVAWRLSKAFIKPSPVAAEPSTKNCQYCRMTIDSTASRCAHCTSQL